MSDCFLNVQRGWGGGFGIPDVDSVAEREFEASRRLTDSQVRALVTETDLCTSHVGDEGSATRPYPSGIRAWSPEFRPSPSQLRDETLAVRKRVAKERREREKTFAEELVGRAEDGTDGPLNLAKKKEHLG